MTFFQKLQAATTANQSLLCVGLDPDLSRMPVKDIAAFNAAIIEATADLVCAYKPNFAFYEAQGMEGMRALEATIRAVPSNIPVIADAKRGDIGHTAEMYARALFDVWGVDACTVNAWGGRDAIEPFIERADRGIFVWCRSSNPGASDFQDLAISTGSGQSSTPLYAVMAAQLSAWNVNHNLALVIGATYPAQLATMRAQYPEMTFLLPGIGSQGGEVQATVTAGIDKAQAGILVAASRQVLYASNGGDFANAARQAAQEMRDEINRYRGSIPS